MTPLSVLGILSALLVAVGAIKRFRRGTWHRRHALPTLTALVGSLALAVATGGAFETGAMKSLPQHMIGHVLVMFIVPMAFVRSGIGHQWEMAIPVRARRPLSRIVTQLAWRGNASLMTAVIFLNVVMVLSHLPVVFDAMMTHSASMRWLVEPAFLVSGWWFFTGLVAGPYRKPRTRLSRQLLAVVVTMVEMLIMAMAMSIFTKTAWYHMSDTMGPMPMSFSSQQLAAAILWICGDFWGVPLVVVIFRRLIDRDGSLLASLESRVRTL